jgi:hypothetical protein
MGFSSAAFRKEEWKVTHNYPAQSERLQHCALPAAAGRECRASGVDQ